MHLGSLRGLMSGMGFQKSQPAKRLTKLRSGWGIETEKLENRALLSASACPDLMDSTVAAEVSAPAKSGKKASTPAPNLAGTWAVEVTGAVNTSGSVVITQSGKGNRTVTSVISVTGLPSLTITDKLPKKGGSSVSGKTPKLDIPGFDKPVALSFTINFTPSGSANPDAFNGTIRVGNTTLAQLSGTRAV